MNVCNLTINLIDKLSYTIFSLFLFGLIGCTDTPELKATLAYVDSTLSTRPDSALILLRTIHPDKIRNPKLKAKHSLLHTIALDKNRIDLKTDSIIRPAVAYYGRKGTPKERALTLYYLSRIYCNNQDSENALKTLSEAESNALTAQHPPLCGLIYNTLGNLYYTQSNFQEAIAMYRRSEFFFTQAGDLQKKANALSYIGKSMRLGKDIDSSTFYYKKAKRLYALLDDGKKVLQMNSSIAEKLVTTNGYEEAKALLQEGYLQYNHNQIPERDYPLWARIHLEQHRPTEAQRFARAALTQQYARGRIQAGLYSLLYQSHLAEGNYKEAYHFLSLYTKKIIADFRQKKENLLQEIQERYAKEKLQASYQSLEREHRYQQIIYLLIVLFLLSVGYLLFLRQRNKRKLLQKQHAQELAEATAYVENIQENYTKLTRRYRAIKEENSKNDEKTIRFLQAFETRLGQMRDILDIAYTTESTPAHFYYKFKEYIHAGSREENAFEDLQYVVNEKYFGIIDHLKKHYPLLNKSDLDFCSMLCFGFSANSIRLIYGHTNLDSIFQKRSRLREKLNLPPNLQLDPFIKKIKAELQAQCTQKGVSENK